MLPGLSEGGVELEVVTAMGQLFKTQPHAPAQVGAEAAAMGQLRGAPPDLPPHADLSHKPMPGGFSRPVVGKYTLVTAGKRLVQKLGLCQARDPHRALLLPCLEVWTSLDSAEKSLCVWEVWRGCCECRPSGQLREVAMSGVSIVIFYGIFIYAIKSNKTWRQ